MGVVTMSERRGGDRRARQWRVRVAGPDEVFEFPDGSVIDQAEAYAISERFEASDPDDVVDRILARGRPLMGEAPARVVPVRLEPSLVTSVDERAAAEGCNRSELIRRALRAYLG